MRITEMNISSYRDWDNKPGIRIDILGDHYYLLYSGQVMIRQRQKDNYRSEQMQMRFPAKRDDEDDREFAGRCLTQLEKLSLLQ